MSFWTAIVVIAAIWGFVQIYSRKRDGQAGSMRDEDLDTGFASREGEAQRELDELRERIKVLERIATDANSAETRETQAIAEEIERLRGEGP